MLLALKDYVCLFVQVAVPKHGTKDSSNQPLVETNAAYPASQKLSRTY